MKIQNINKDFDLSNIRKQISIFFLAGFLMTLLSCRCDLEEDKEDQKNEINKTLENDQDSIALKKIS